MQTKRKRLTRDRFIRLLGSGLEKPFTKRQWSALGHVNVSKAHSIRATRVLVKQLQNIGVPVEVGIDLRAHRLHLAFELPDSGKRVSKILFQLFDFLFVSHKYARKPNAGTERPRAAETEPRIHP
jgi:hypothetical protein